MFPIRAVGGEVIGFGGRVLDDSKPKYINSPETPVFSKGRELYGLFEARQALRDKGYALVVEGYMDVVALAQSASPTPWPRWARPARPTMCKSCSASPMPWSSASTATPPGPRRRPRAGGALPHATDLRTVRFLFLPPEHDPDSFVRELGAAAFEQLVARPCRCRASSSNRPAEGATWPRPKAARACWRRPGRCGSPARRRLKRQLLPELARQAQLE
jgi:DNA primase